MRLENFHTHTYRCNHAKGKDIEYVKMAIDQGFDVLGFSDHTPWPDSEKFPGDNSRMKLEGLSEYVNTVNSLKEEYSGKIDIRLGLECEPFLEHFSWLEDMKEEMGIEYLLLGNHYVGEDPDEEFIGREFDPKNTLRYVKKLEKSMTSRLFKYIAHPDLLFSNYPTSDAYVTSVSNDICQMAQDTKTALEYNLSGIWKREAKKYHGIGFPCQRFWEVASTYDIDTYIGFDAHSPNKIERDLFIQEARKLKSMGLRVLNFEE